MSERSEHIKSRSGKPLQTVRVYTILRNYLAGELSNKGRQGKRGQPAHTVQTSSL